MIIILTNIGGAQTKLLDNTKIPFDKADADKVINFTVGTGFVEPAPVETPAA